MAGRGATRRGTPPAEWAIAAVGGALLVALLAYTAYLGWRHPEGPPELAVSAVGVRATEAGHVVEFRAQNAGGAGVEDVSIEAALFADGEAVERRSVTIAELPQRAGRRGAVIFDRDPGEYALELRIEGYALP